MNRRAMVVMALFTLSVVVPVGAAQDGALETVDVSTRAGSDDVALAGGASQTLERDWAFQIDQVDSGRRRVAEPWPFALAGLGVLAAIRLRRARR